MVLLLLFGTGKTYLVANCTCPDTYILSSQNCSIKLYSNANNIHSAFCVPECHVSFVTFLKYNTNVFKYWCVNRHLNMSANALRNWDECWTYLT